jgi:ribonuclease HI
MTLRIYCDGSADERSGRPGGWAFLIVREGKVLLSGSGGERSTTNNVMELQAALSGLEAVRERKWHDGERVELVSDSRVTLDAASGAQLPRKHLELAHRVFQASADVSAQPRWIRGHSGDTWNEAVDALAHEARWALVPEKAKRRAARRSLAKAPG